MQKLTKPQLNHPKAKQKGAVLIMMAFIIGLAVIAYLVHALDPARFKAEQDKKTMQSLNAAKQSLIAWAVSHQYAPGQMPWPDRNGDLNYDGSSDCMPVFGVFTYSLMLGQLPSLPTTSPCLDPNTGLNIYPALSTYPGLGQEFRDSQGNKLWYAVSRNLVYDYEKNEAPIINPGMSNAPHAITPYLRQGGTQSYPWLKVLDRNANLVSDRVAVVLIAPGDPINGQVRAAAAAPNQFLDGFKIGAANYKNSDSALVDEDFIMGEDSRNVSASDLTFVQPYNFNDKLVFITIDELMAALEKRVGEQVRSSLKTYQDTNGYYPYAAQLGTTVMYSGAQNLKSGFLPVNPQNCSYNASPLSIPILSTRVSGSQNLTTLASFTAVSKGWGVSGAGIPSDTAVLSVTNANQLALSSLPTSSGIAILTFTQPTIECVQPLFDAASTAISAITEVRFYLPTGSFTAALGCTMQSGNTRCYCTGAGYCSNITTKFSCNLSSCKATGAGSAGDIFIRGGKLTSSSGGCVITTPITKNVLTNCPITTTSRITCNSTDGQFSSHSNGDVRFDSFLPNWFNQNQWGNFVYYEMTRPANSTIAVGVTPADATVVLVGSPILPQARPSCNALNSYLDSAENVSANSVYDAASKQRANNYNDQTFVVLP